MGAKRGGCGVVQFIRRAVPTIRRVYEEAKAIQDKADEAFGLADLGVIDEHELGAAMFTAARAEWERGYYASLIRARGLTARCGCEACRVVEAYAKLTFCSTPRHYFRVTIGTQSLRPKLAGKESCGFRDFRSSNCGIVIGEMPCDIRDRKYWLCLNGVQGVAGSNPAVPIHVSDLNSTNYKTRRPKNGRRFL
jgi:hypothetical protein